MNSSDFGLLFILCLILSTQITAISIDSKPIKCSKDVSEVESIISQVSECLKKKWEPSDTLLKRLLPTGIPRLFGNGSVFDMLSNVKILPNISLSLSEFIKKWIPWPLKKRSEAANDTDINKRTLKLDTSGGDALNERTCCLLLETICAQNKAYRMNCKMGDDFDKEVDQMYDQLADSCSKVKDGIDQTFCDSQKTKTIEVDVTCDQYIPCSVDDKVQEYGNKSDHLMSSQMLLIVSFALITVIINFNLN